MKTTKIKSGRPRQEKKVQVSVYLPEKDANKLRRHCERSGRVMSRVVAKLVTQMLAQL